VRIILSCLQSPIRHAIPAYAFWRDYFVMGCEEAGIECLEVPGVDWAAGVAAPSAAALAAWRSHAWTSTVQFAKKKQAGAAVDLFVGYLYPRQVESGAIREIQKLGIPCVNFFCDNVREFDRVPNEYEPFDLHWVPEFEALPLYREAGLRHLHAPMPCWIPSEFRQVPLEETSGPTFVGSADVLRRDLLGRAVAAGADIHVLGPGWADADASLDREARVGSSFESVMRNQRDVLRTKGVAALTRKALDRLFPLNPPGLSADRRSPGVFGREYARVLRESMVSLGINRVPSWRRTVRNPLSYSRLRDIEAPMLGACFLTEWTEGLGTLFELGHEIEAYRTPEEMAVKINELKHDAPRRRKMRERSQKRALSEHSVGRSLGRIAQALGVGSER
jgi:hypothetical protein